MRSQKVYFSPRCLNIFVQYFKCWLRNILFTVLVWKNYAYLFVVTLELEYIKFTLWKKNSFLFFFLLPCCLHLVAKVAKTTLRRKFWRWTTRLKYITRSKNNCSVIKLPLISARRKISRKLQLRSISKTWVLFYRTDNYLFWAEKLK